MGLFEKNNNKQTRKYFKIDYSPYHSKKQPMDQRVLLTMTAAKHGILLKQLTNKLRTAQRAMERKMFNLKLQDKVPWSEIRKRTKIIDIIEYTLKQNENGSDI